MFWSSIVFDLLEAKPAMKYLKEIVRILKSAIKIQSAHVFRYDNKTVLIDLHNTHHAHVPQRFIQIFMIVLERIKINNILKVTFVDNKKLSFEKLMI